MHLPLHNATNYIIYTSLVFLINHITLRLSYLLNKYLPGGLCFNTPKSTGFSFHIDEFADLRIRFLLDRFFNRNFGSKIPHNFDHFFRGIDFNLARILVDINRYRAGGTITFPCSRTESRFNRIN